MPLFPSLFGSVDIPSVDADYRNPTRPNPRVRRPRPRPTR
jgi:hypothetical protein